ncbi:hypothetical protein BRC2024_QFGIOCBO_CDS_0117 [Acinetobacter phage vB_AbaM_PhT2-v2]
MQLPRSTYIVCDPCYVMLEEAYSQLCDQMYPSNWATDGIVSDLKINGHNLWVHNTRFGDGIYESNSSVKFMVDSGSLGAIPLELCNMDEVNRLLAEKNAVLFTDEVVYTGYYEGTFTFALEVTELVIFTDDDPEDRYYEDEHDELFGDE